MVHQSTHRRRAAMYMIVLATAMLVTVIGLGGLMAARTQFHIGQANNQAMQARFYAQSAIDLALYKLSADVSWRSNLSNDTWEADRVLDVGLFRWKPVDEQDGDLDDDSTDEVRIYGTGIVGDTVRTYSVALVPRGNEPNLLRNPGFESGTSGWQSWNCTLVTDTSGPHSGTTRVLLFNRGASNAQGYQNVASTIQNGETYYVEVWAQSDGSSEDIRISLKTIGSSSGTRTFATPAVSVDGSWTLVSGTLTPTWTGTLTEARWRVFSPSGGSRDFFIDDTVMRVDSDPTELELVPGSWRREVSP